jgi:hypothetical protein
MPLIRVNNGVWLSVTAYDSLAEFFEAVQVASWGKRGVGVHASGSRDRVQGLESSRLIGVGAFRCPFKILRLPSTPPVRAFPCRSYTSLAAYSPFPGCPSIRNGRSPSAMQVSDHASDLVSPTGDSGATSPCSQHLDAMDPYRAAHKYIPL